MPAVHVFALRAIKPRARRDIRLVPDDRFDPEFAGVLVERDRAVHVAVIGHGQRWVRI